MKVLVDARSLDRPRTGVGSYTAGLLSALRKKRSLDITELHFGGQGGNLIWPRIVNQLFRWRVLMPLDLFRRKALFLFPDFVTLPLVRSKSITIIHDLTFLQFPNSMDQKNRRFLETEVPRSLHNSTHIVVNSHATKRDIIERYVHAPEDISVVYPGVDLKSFRPQVAKKQKAVQKKYNIGPNYILFVGTIEPRKNLPVLIEAFLRLPHGLDKYELVLAGNEGWEDELDKVKSLIKRAKVKYIGPVEQKDLPALYSGATVFVLPSLFEGFGMPVIEAMACGTPVICADNSSLPEAVGNAGLMFKAEDVNGLRAQLVQVLDNDKLADKMSKAGLKHAKQFTWASSADKLLSIIKSLDE